VAVNFEAVFANGSPGSLFGAQTNGGTNYWIPSEPYISAEVTNAPPDSDILQLVGGENQIYRITFSEPIVDPIMAILTLGAAGTPTTYDFDAPFTIVSQGTGWWGGTETSLSELPGDILLGEEGRDDQVPRNVLQLFLGRADSENWHGFTFAIRSAEALDATGSPSGAGGGEIETGEDFGNRQSADAGGPVFRSASPTTATVGQPPPLRRHRRRHGSRL
jgi:hypothetical protein